jgi:hypothetical protein
MRKQVYELTAADLEAHPVWEHCLDEEGRPNQDEATVRPYDPGGKPLEYVGMLVVKSTLTLANGRPFPGYLYYTPDVPGSTYGPLANLQPHALTPAGQVMFWFGRLQPGREAIADAYRKLGADAAGVFPVRYATEVTLATGPVQGEIAGFQYIAERKKGWFSRESYVATTSSGTEP